VPSPHRPRFRIPLALLLALLAWTSAAPAQDDAARADAVRLYDEGRYAEAGELLARLDAAGRADGPLLYRLYFCQRESGSELAGKTQERAREALERELPKAKSLEVPFYLANVYGNQGQLSERKRVAAEAARLVASGSLPAPAASDGVAWFRLAKLQEYAGNDESARDGYRHALDAFGADPDAGRAYTRFAADYLLKSAEERKDWVEAERYLALELEQGGGNAAQYDRLAVLGVRAGHFDDAVTAWRRAGRANPADADRARYAANLAAMAAKLAPLPQSAPDGRPFAELGKEELETLLVEQSKRAKDAVAEAKGDPAPSAQRLAELRAASAAAKPLFVAAGLEYVLRGYGIRETAFFGGYAPLIFRESEWNVPGRAGAKGKGKAKGKAKGPVKGDRPDPPAPGS